MSKTAIQRGKLRINQQGQAMVEMVIISFVSLLLLFGIVQFALLYNAKTILNYAAFEAARVGAVNYSHPLAMRLALAQKLATLEPVQQKNGETDYQQLIDQQENLLSATNTSGDNLFDSIACIKRINPPTSSGHWDTKVAVPESKYGIVNDHLMNRDAKPEGGPKQSIQDANLLKISVTYCPKMIVPIVASVVKKFMLLELSQPVSSLSEFNKQCYQNDRFPMIAQAIIRMQTPAGKFGFTSNDCDDITNLQDQLN